MRSLCKLAPEEQQMQSSLSFIIKFDSKSASKQKRTDFQYDIQNLDYCHYILLDIQLLIHRDDEWFSSNFHHQMFALKIKSSKITLMIEKFDDLAMRCWIVNPLTTNQYSMGHAYHLYGLPSTIIRFSWDHPGCKPS